MFLLSTVYLQGGIVNGTLLAIKYMGIPSGGNGGIVVQTTASMIFRDNTLCTSMYKSTKTCVMDFTKIFVVCLFGCF